MRRLRHAAKDNRLLGEGLPPPMGAGTVNKAVHSRAGNETLSMKSQVQRQTMPSVAGYSLIEIMVVVALVGVVAVLAVPNAMTARTTASRSVCLAALKQIESAKEQWAVEHKKSGGDTALDDDLFGLDKYLKYKPKCPEGGSYLINANHAKPACSVAGHTL